MKTVLTNWRRYLAETKAQTSLVESKLRIFDFDDTLARTDSKIVLLKNDGSRLEQTPGEWAVYKPQPGDEFDYSQFRGPLINPKEIKEYTRILRGMIGVTSPGRKNVILTARDSQARQGILDFLRDINVDASKLELITLGSSDPMDKARYIEGKIGEGFDDVMFFDDSEKNIKAVNSLKSKYPHVRILSRLV